MVGLAFTAEGREWIPLAHPPPDSTAAGVKESGCRVALGPEEVKEEEGDAAAAEEEGAAKEEKEAAPYPPTSPPL